MLGATPNSGCCCISNLNSSRCLTSNSKRISTKRVGQLEAVKIADANCTSTSQTVCMVARRQLSKCRRIDLDQCTKRHNRTCRDGPYRFCDCGVRRSLDWIQLITHWASKLRQTFGRSATLFRQSRHGSQPRQDLLHQNPSTRFFPPLSSQQG